MNYTVKIKSLLLIFVLCQQLGYELVYAETVSIGGQPATLIQDAPVQSVPSRAWVDFGFSSWSPDQLTAPARFGSDVPFARSGLPSFFGDYSFQFTSSQDWNAKIGANWLSLSRSAPLTVNGVGSMAEESAQLISARIGIEYTPQFLRSRLFAPYAGVAILPTALIIGESAFDSGSTYFGVPAEVTLGTRLELKAMGISWNQAELDLAVMETVGKMHDSSLSGFGINGGVRVSL